MHVVGTYDGAEICMYINGEMVSRSNAEGDLKPSDIASRFFAIGANSGAHDQALEAMFCGKLADVKIYSAELSADQIAELYDQYNS